jgi:signal transduction histidine kinase
MQSSESSPISPDAIAPSEHRSQMTLSLLTKIRVGFALAVLILVVIAASAYYSTTQFLELARQTTQTSAGLQVLTQSLSLLKDAETGQRGYLLTQDDAYLEPYELATRDMPGQITALEQWSQARPENRPMVDEVVRLAAKKFAELAETISLNQQVGAPAALALVRSNEGKQAMDDIRVAISGIDSHERQVLAGLLEQANLAGQRSRWTVLIGGGIACLLVGLSLAVISRDVAGRYRAEATIQARTAEIVRMNQHLRQENHDRQLAQEAHQRAEEEVRVLNAQLESRVKQRTLLLEAANREVRALNTGLEARVSERTAQLEAANKELEAFSYSVSHDLRSPLRAINGFSQALEEEARGALNETGQDYLRRIIKATQRMGRLIDDLLSLARVSRSQLVRESVDLTEVVESVVAELQEQDPQRHVDVVVAPHVTVDGDPKLLRVALQNLVANAWKFTGKRPQAEIEFGIRNEEGSRAFFVRDNGAGFDPAFAGKLFGVFQRLHSMEEFAGTGIGLATVQRIIHRHGGRVWADAKQGEGATFYFSL